MRQTLRSITNTCIYVCPYPRDLELCQIGLGLGSCVWWLHTYKYSGGPRHATNNQKARNLIRRHSDGHLWKRRLHFLQIHMTYACIMSIADWLCLVTCRLCLVVSDLLGLCLGSCIRWQHINTVNAGYLLLLQWTARACIWWLIICVHIYYKYSDEIAKRKY